ncbi:MAG: cell division protein FtsA [Chitinispirillales bacterium]|nr:cell division protein FtsA [Chitinispirillales bacterium]
MESDIFVGLDMGTTKIACIIAEQGENNVLKVIGVGVSPSDGLRKGTVVDIDTTVKSIKKAVEEAELMAGVDVHEVCVGIAGDHIKGKTSTGFVAISHDNREIAQEDVDRVIEVAKAIQMPQDYDLLHVLSRGYSVDDQNGIKNPLGMCGVRLTTQVYIITGQAARVLDITKCVEKAELKLSGQLVLEPLASSRAVLEKDEKELGVALVDIGGGTTDIAIYSDENIRHTAIVGLGGKNVTRDIGIGLRTPLEKAEEIKRKYGCAYQPLLRGGERLMVPAVGGHEDREILREGLVNIIEPRVEEILSLALREIKKSGCQDMLGAGVVLTGGGAMLEGMREKAENVFQMPVKIGVPSRFGGLTEAARSPMHATGIGLCMFAADGARSKGGRKKSKAKPINIIAGWLKRYF